MFWLAYFFTVVIGGTITFVVWLVRRLFGIMGRSLVITHRYANKQ